MVKSKKVCGMTASVLATLGVLVIVVIVAVAYFCGLFNSKNEISAEGTYTICSTDIVKGVHGYNGEIPLQITITDGRISAVEAMKNSESPEYFSAVNDVMLPKYVGLTPEEVVNGSVDGITGATYSSNGVRETMLQCMQYVIDNSKK